MDILMCGAKKTPRSSRGSFSKNGIYALAFEQLEQADLSAFLVLHVLQTFPSLHAVHSVLMVGFLAEQPQRPQANALLSWCCDARLIVDRAWVLA